MNEVNSETEDFYLNLIDSFVTWLEFTDKKIILSYFKSIFSIFYFHISIIR